MKEKKQVKGKSNINGLIKGEVKAFDEIFEIYNQRIYQFAKVILKNKEDAKDVVQEVFLRIWQNRNEINEYSTFKSYLFTIAYNIIVDHFRKRLKDKKYKDFLEANIKEVDFSQEKNIEFSYLNELYEQAVEQLPPRRKLIYKMNRNEGLTYKEIAERLNISRNTVRNQMAKTLQFLRKKIGKETLLFMLFCHLFI